MPLERRAEDLHASLRDRALPRWSQYVDQRHGGFLLSPSEKQLATQSRMVWAFSHVHNRGLGDYLPDAERGVEFLFERLWDRKHGGFFWKADRSGRTLDERKLLYGQAFAIYGLVEYGRAAGSADAVDRALGLFRLLAERARDREHGGWLEHFEPGWRPITAPDSPLEVEIAGLKSANAHLHVLEALTELHAETGEAEVRRALSEAVDLCTAWFFPSDPAAASQHRRVSWEPGGTPGVSVGHNVEFAWLLTRAEAALGRRPSLERLDAYLAHARAAREDVLVWWVTAETLAALATAVANRPYAVHRSELEDLLAFALAHQIDPSDGMWLHTVARDGTVVNATKVETWKDAYHETRATILLRDALLP